MATSHHRHQASLEGLINFSSSPSLEESDRIQARTRFHDIVRHFEDRENAGSPYNRPKLLRLTYEYATSDKSQDNTLRAFFGSVGLPITGEDAIDLSVKETEDQILSKVIGFADYLIDNFFLPLKASTRRTPQPSPAYHSSVQSVQAGGQTFVGTTARLKNLRGSCLIRDRHRCVISHGFDQIEAVERIEKSGDNAKDDDGHLIINDSYNILEVAHILPHSLVKTNSNSELDASREAALKVLNMFDHDGAHLIEGPEIDRPRNALTLSQNLHYFFGDFKIFFDPVDGQSNTYRIDTFLPRQALHNLLPVTRTLFLTETRTIEPPSPRLLAIHRAIAHILHLSAAGRYIDDILRDADEQLVRVDGSTSLGRLVQLRVDGWLNGIGA